MLTATAALATPFVTGCVGRSVDEVDWDTTQAGGGGSGSTEDGGSDSGSGNAGKKEQTIEVGDGAFSPGRVELAVGGTVTWKNTTDEAHRVKSITYTSGATQWPFDEEVAAGESASFTFDSKGVYQYYDIDAGQYRMCGMILVGGATSDFESSCISSS